MESSQAEQDINLTDDDENPTETRESQREEELSLYWSFIVNMLTNLDAMPIERIHQMLKIFAMQVDRIDRR